MRLLFRIGCIYLASFILMNGGVTHAYKLSDTRWMTGTPKSFTICTKDAPIDAVKRIKEAAEKWNYSKFKYTFNAEKCLDDPSWIQPDGISYISFGDVAGSDFGSDTAEAFDRNIITKADLIECDIRLNRNRKWYTKLSGTPANDENDLLSVAMHEFGHCLGLDHSNVQGAVMSDMLLPGNTRRSLTQDDVDGRNSIYGKP